MTSTFYLNWQDPDSRAWHPVAKLMRLQNCYIFAYTNGARKSRNFVPFGNMSDVEAIYVSETLFPLFANRLMNDRRPEFKEYAKWTGMSAPQQTDPLLIMARMEGARATDSLRVYPAPEPDRDNMYRTVFFSHGIRYLPKSAQQRTFQLGRDEPLFAMMDCQNQSDHKAIALRTSDPAEIVGYCPRNLSDDISKLMKNPDNRLRVKIKLVNYDAPPQFRLLCEATSMWPKDFAPFSNDEHKTIVSFDAKAIERYYSQRSHRKDSHDLKRA